MSSLPFIMHILFIVTHTHMRARMHAHTQGPGNMFACGWQQATVCPLLRLWPWLQVQNADVWRLSNIKAHPAMLEILYLCQARSLSQLKRHCVFFSFECGLDKKKLVRRRVASIFFWKLTCYDADSDFTVVHSKPWRSDDKSSSSATARKVDALGQITFPSTKLHGKEVSSNRIWVAYVWLSFCSTSIVVYAVPGRPWSCSNFERTHGRAITKIRQQRTRTDPHRGCRVECISCEHQASQCSSTAINEQEKLERKRALCLKREEGKRTGLWSTLAAKTAKERAGAAVITRDARGAFAARSRSASPRLAPKRWRNFRWRWRFTRTGGLCSVLMVLGGGGVSRWNDRLSAPIILSANFAANTVDVIRPGQGVIDNDPEQASLLNKFHFSAIKIDPEIDCWNPWSSVIRDGEISIATVFPELISSPRSSRQSHDFSLLRTDETRSQAAVGDSEDAYSCRQMTVGRGALCAVTRSAKSDT